MSPIRHIISSLLLVACALPAIAADKQPPNILFLSIDDLRPELGAYGSEFVKSPNIDAIATNGVLFENAYSSVPVCGASRASMLSGLRPTMTRFVSVSGNVDKEAPGVVTLPQFFHEQGYTTVSIGKIYHSPKDDKDAWDSVWKPVDEGNNKQTMGGKGYVSPANQAYIADPKNKRKGKQPAAAPYENEDVADNAYFDGMSTDRAIQNLTDFAKNDKPFFLALGFSKPHLPFNAPKKYWDMYDRTSLTPPTNGERAKNTNARAYHSWGELRAYKGVPKEKDSLVGAELATTLRHGYYASISYVDAQVGRVIAKLEELNLADNTIIVVWGDHGWSLGEHTLWAKHSQFSIANDIPLIISAPNAQKSLRVASPAESVDIYPTLAGLAGFTAPHTVEGDDLTSVLTGKVASVKDAAYTRWRDSDTIRTERYHYTEWRRAKTGKVYDSMLFDHKNDPGETENVIAQNPEVVAELQKKLHKHINKYEGKAPVVNK